MPKNLGAGVATPYPSSKNTPKACLTRNPATSPARHTYIVAPAQALVTLNRGFSGDIRTIIIVIIIVRGEEGGEKTLKLSNTQQDTLNTMHCKTTRTYKRAHLIATE